MDTGTDGSATFPNLVAGSYAYNVSASGYNPATNTRTVIAGQTVSTSVTLTLTPTTGSLKVTVSGPNGYLQGGTVTITSGPSGQTLPIAGTTGADGSVTFSGLLPGSYSLSIAAEGYITATGSAIVNVGATDSVNMILDSTPAPALPAIGSLKVTVSGSNGPIQGATLSFVSVPYGQGLPAARTTDVDGSVTFSNLPPGDYSYQVIASGYENAWNSVTVSAGQTQSSSVTMSPVQPAACIVRR